MSSKKHDKKYTYQNSNGYICKRYIKSKYKKDMTHLIILKF